MLYSERGTGPIFRSQENKCKGVDTDGKWGNREALVTYVGAFLSPARTLPPAVGPTGVSATQHCLGRTMLVFIGLPARLLGWGHSLDLGAVWKESFMDRIPKSTHTLQESTEGRLFPYRQSLFQLLNGSCLLEIPQAFIKNLGDPDISFTYI